jgi:proteic killer suppression protein
MALPFREHMDLVISDRKLRRAIEDDAIKGRYGTVVAKKVELRLAALRAAASLGDFWPPKSGPERCHEIMGDRAGAFSVDLKHPYRLLFKPIEATPPPDRSDETQRWESITSIDILGIEDTHD